MGGLLDVSKSGFYEWRSRPQSAAARRREDLAALIRHVFEDSDGTYGPTPRSLGVSVFLGSCGAGVLYVSWSLFPGGVRAWFLPACRGGGGARFHGPRPACAGRFLLPGGPGEAIGLVETGREYGDLGFPGDGCLGGGGVREFRAGFLCAF